MLHAPQTSNAGVSPFVEITRDEWAKLASSTPLPLTSEDIERLRGLDDPIDYREVDDVYRPLSRLLNLYAAGTAHLHAQTSDFLGEKAHKTPFVIGVAGSVAVGKSTTSRLLRELLARWPDTPHVELVTTDGFIYPNAELEKRGILERKGFPESYDRRALLRFLTEVKSGAALAYAPVYSHLRYDIVPGERVAVEKPDVLIVEGLNVLQPPPAGNGMAVSDLFDFSIYVDARTDDIAHWFTQRVLSLHKGAFANPQSYFHSFTEFSTADVEAYAKNVWATINLPNLENNIQPTRSRAHLVLQKGPDHAVRSVLLRKL